MDTQTEQAATNVVDAMVEAREMFTAFDVTSQLRQQGHQVNHRGTDGVRDFVHSNYTAGVDGLIPSHYLRTLHDFGKGPAFIFRPHDADINDYDPTKWQPGSKTSTQTTVATVNDPVSDGKIKTDQRGRLCIRASLIRKLGVGPGEKVVVFSSSDKTEMRISNASIVGIFPAGAKLRDLRIDGSSGLRVGPKTIECIFGKSSKLLGFEMDFKSSGSQGTYVRVVAD